MKKPSFKNPRIHVPSLGHLNPNHPVFVDMGDVGKLEITPCRGGAEIRFIDGMSAMPHRLIIRPHVANSVDVVVIQNRSTEKS